MTTEKKEKEKEGGRRRKGLAQPTSQPITKPLLAYRVAQTPRSLIHLAPPLVRSQHHCSFPISIFPLAHTAAASLALVEAHSQINRATAPFKIYHASIDKSELCANHRCWSYREWQKLQLLGLVGWFSFHSFPSLPISF